MIRIGFVRAHLSGDPPSTSRAIAYGLGLIAAPTIIRIMIDPVISGLAFVTYFPFVLVAALFMSWGQAMAVTLASAMLANYLFMEPRFTLFATQSDTIGSIFFIIASSMIVAVGETLRRAVRELEQSRTREAHLNRELQHRVKNTLAVVQGLATQTFRSVSGAGEPLDKLHGRIRALSEANEILRHGQWEECRLPELALRALEPFNTKGALDLVGPECSLPEESCVPLVLALHELATNAVKYGALSTEKGSVLLSWGTVGERAGKTGLHMRWQESGGPSVAQPAKRGLGAKLLRPQLGLDDVKVAFEPTGVECEIHVIGARPIGAGEESALQHAPAIFYANESPAAAS
jgi:two-component sensor histidine kinase